MNVLIVFSIISTICIMCIGLIYSNNNIYSLEYEYEKLREKSLSGIEIAYSNVLKEVKFALENSSTKEEFNSYFIGNNSTHIINRITSISDSGLNDVLVNVLSKGIYSDNEYIYLDIQSNARQLRNSKQIEASIKVKNPWINEDVSSEDNNEVIINSDNNSSYIDENKQVDTTTQNENIGNIFNKNSKYIESDLVKIYNYKEL